MEQSLFYNTQAKDSCKERTIWTSIFYSISQGATREIKVNISDIWRWVRQILPTLLHLSCTYKYSSFMLVLFTVCQQYQQYCSDECHQHLKSISSVRVAYSKSKTLVRKDQRQRKPGCCCNSVWRWLDRNIDWRFTSKWNRFYFSVIILSFWMLPNTPSSNKETEKNHIASSYPKNLDVQKNCEKYAFVLRFGIWS